MLRGFTGFSTLAALLLGGRHAQAGDVVAMCADAAESGQELRNGQDLVTARARFLTCAQRDCPSEIRESCMEWLADLDRRLPSFVVSVKDADGRDVTDASIQLDGAVLPPDVVTAAQPCNPGPHVIRVEASGFLPREQRILLHEAERLRVVSMTLDAPAHPVDDRSTSEGSAHRSALPILPLILGGVSVAALGTFVGMGLSGRAAYRNLESGCAPKCAETDIDRVRTRFVVADVALVIGVASALAGGTLWWLESRPSRPAAH